MGPNSINTFSSAPSLSPSPEPAQAGNIQSATAANGLKIHYGDSIKADRLQAGLRGLQAAQAKTERYIRTINPELDKP